MAEDPRATLGELAAQIERHFGRRLEGLYLFGSLAAGGFYPARSDLDLLAVLDSPVAGGNELASLRELHERFEAERPEWRDRIEVLYLSRTVLASFVSQPQGQVARISPGEPLHHRDLGGDIGWILDWHSVVTVGETLFGRPPLTLGPAVSGDRFHAAVLSHLRWLREQVRRDEAQFMPTRQRYIAATVCRALYSLVTGEQISKERALEWAAETYPRWSEVIRAAYRADSADGRRPGERLIEFVDDALDQAERLTARP